MPQGGTVGKIEINGSTLAVRGEIGYDLAGEFAQRCAVFIERHRGAEAVLDLSEVQELVSPCLTAIYEECRLHHPAALRVVVRRNSAQLFEPGVIENLYTLEVL
jgi:hypothetical protein